MSEIEENTVETTETDGVHTLAAKLQKAKHVKVRTGTVVSAKAEKTVTVAVDRRVKHKSYGKYITRMKNYAAHDELGCEEGDRVILEETRPMSKTKRWKVVEKLGKEH